MSDDEGRLLIDDVQDGSVSIDHELPASPLVDIRDTENTSINKLSTPLTVPVFGQPQVTSSSEVHFHSSTPSKTQRREPSPFAFTNNLVKLHCEHETSSNNTSSPKHRKRPQQETGSSVFALKSDNHSLATTPSSKGRTDTLSSRKRKDSSLDEHNYPDSEAEETSSKKHKQMRDRGTCVYSKAVQSDMDCPLFDLEVGATRLVEMTVVCKMEMGRTVPTVVHVVTRMIGPLAVVLVLLLNLAGGPKKMSDDEGRLLIDDVQDGSVSIDHELPASPLVDIKSAQGDTENTSINKLSTPLTVPVFGQPQVTSSSEVHFHSSTPSKTQRREPSPFAFTNNLVKLHCEHETSSNNTSSPKHRKRPQQETGSSVFALKSDNHSLATTPRSSFSSHECSGLQGDSSVNGKRQKRYKTNGMSKGRTDTLSSRKRKDSSLDEHNYPDSEAEETSSKKHKQMRDRGTCVYSKAVQSDMDCPLFDLEVGATRLVEMTVVCKMENNELYVVAKWKDQEFSGILTDGHPPAYLPYMKKRSTTVAGSGSNSSNGSACGDSNDRATGSGASTPSKSRSQQPGTPRDPKKRVPSCETKRKLSCSLTRPGSSIDPPDEDDDLDVEASASGSVSNLDSYKLIEVPGRKSMHICTVDGCQHRYSRSEEMEYHKATVHAKKAVMYEAICCQTDISAFRRRSVETDVDGLAHSESPRPSTPLEETPVKKIHAYLYRRRMPAPIFSQ
ncbi:hypothetical protein OSTOST_04458 [Ostertagia ostertagi]